MESTVGDAHCITTAVMICLQIQNQRPDLAPAFINHGNMKGLMKAQQEAIEEAAKHGSSSTPGTSRLGLTWVRKWLIEGQDTRDNSESASTPPQFEHQKQLNAAARKKLAQLRELKIIDFRDSETQIQKGALSYLNDTASDGLP